MNLEKEELMHYRFERDFNDALFVFSEKSPKVIKKLRFYYIMAFAEMLKWFPVSFVYTEIKLRIIRNFRYHGKKSYAIGVLIDKLDKGGMEEVVYNLVSNFNPPLYTFIVGNKLGEKGWLLTKEGFYVYVIDDNWEEFTQLVKKNNIKLINSHFSIWNLNKIKELGCKIVYTIHSQYTWIEYPPLVTQRINAYEYVDWFIAVSDLTKEYFSFKFKTDESKITVIENGFKMHSFYYKKKRSRQKEGEFIFVNVGTISPLKNQLLSVSAFKEFVKKHKNSKLYLIGDTSDVEYMNLLKNYIKRNHLSKKIFIKSYVLKKDLFKFYLKSNCMILSSLQEGAPNVLLEALYFGIPTISTDVGNAKNLLQDSGIIISNSYENLNFITIDKLIKIGSSVNQRNKQELIRAMSNVYENYDFWLSKAKQGWTFIKSLYNVNVMIDGYKVLFNKICK